MLRSEEMTLCQLIERNEMARIVVTELGEAGLVQFRDMNGDTPVYKRPFSEELKRCDDMSRKVTWLFNQLENVGLPAPEYDLPEDGVEMLPGLDAVEDALKAAKTELEASRTQELLVRKAHNALKEHIHVLNVGGQLFEEAAPAKPRGQTRDTKSSYDQVSTLAAPLLASDFGTGKGPSGHEESLLRVQAGVLPRALTPALVRAVHRITRGNCVVRDMPIEEPLLGMPADGRYGEPTMMPKNVFLLLYTGSSIHAKVTKLCTHFGATLYLYPESRDQRNALVAQTGVQLVEMRELLLHTSTLRKKTLAEMCASLAIWARVVKRERATLTSLNMLQFDLQRKVFVGEVWCPTAEVPKLRLALKGAAVKAGGDMNPILNELETKDTPPTFLRTNRFTSGFQGLVDTYGIPRYREVNPGAFAIILFPFLFAIMFGDVGHGSLLVLVALYFIANEKKLGKAKLEDIIQMVFGGRYVILLNGLFAVYVGFLYNEAFSVPFGLFKSSWQEVKHEVWFNGTVVGHTVSVEWDKSVYPFGVDPMWHMAANKMTFFNSYKMKLSIVFGVAQMTLGITLQMFNHIQFKDRRSIWFGYVPEITFFLGIFGYLVYMILKKWSIDWVAEKKQPPSLLNVLISMFMSPGKYTEADMLYEGQDHFQLFLLVIAVTAVPFLLIPKPLLFYLDMKKEAAEKAEKAATLGEVVVATGAATAKEGSEDGDEAGHAEEEEGELGEVIVHQVIHTIEFVLGSISNTASYLRLWALSLAHSQLSELFWEKVMKENAFPAAKLPMPFNGLVLMLLFSAWTFLNLGVLMVMENLSSVLHALRLQWVEFQNKFYNGDGYRFVPFSYAALIHDGNDD